MTSPPDDTTTDTSAIIAALRAERDAALSEKAALTEALATRNTEYRERIEHQAATIDVLKVMSASPGDAQPVFDLIVRHATQLCDVPAATLNEYDGELVHMRSSYRSETIMASSALAAYMRLFPMRPTRGSITCRAILDRQIIHIRDLEADPELAGFVRELGHRSQVSVPLIRNGLAIGVISITAREPGGFSENQVALLQTFAEQAVIAITSAETYRALQTRTSDLQETLEYQTATSDVLKVISQSTFDLQPVLDTLVETAARLCEADLGLLSNREGELYRVAASFGASPEYEAFIRGRSVSRDRGTVAGRVARSGQVVQVSDLTADPEFTMTESVTLGKMRTVIGVPLLREGVVAGVLSLARGRVENFTDQQVELVRTFADQAVIAIENTRLITEQREALEQQTATAEVLQVINASPGNLAPVYDAMLEKAMHLCGAVFGSLTAWDGKYANVLAMRGYPPALAQYMAARGPRATIPPVIAQLAETRRPQQVADVVAGEGYRNGHPVSRAVADLGGARTILHVPLRKDEAMVGYISVYRQEVRAFTDKQIALLENFAAQAVIAIENTRLLTEQREALEQQTATAEVLQVINASPGNLTPVFDTILEKALRLCEAAFGSLVPFDGEYFQFGVTRGMSSGLVDALRKRGPVRPSASIAYDQIARGADIVHIPDITDPLLPPPPSSPNIHQDGARTTLFVALRGDDALFGVFIIFRKEVRPFSDKQIALVKNFAAQAVIAMENARLIDEQREALERQTATAEVLQVINASPGNLTPVFEAILEKAHILCSTTCGSLELIDRDRIYAVAVRGFSETFADVLRNGDLAAHQPATGPLMRGEQYNHVIDVSQIDHPTFRGAAKEGLGTVLFTPLRKDGVLLGMIASARLEVRPFSEKEIALLESFAAQAVIAMENSRLLNEVRQRQEELRITFENMGDGVAMFDETQHLVAWNRKFQDILDVPDDIIARRQTFSEYVHYLAERGEYAPEADPEEHVRRLIEQAGQSRTYERIRPDGRLIEVRHNPVPDGGFVLIFSDITERKRNEAEIRAARDAAEEASRTIEAAYRELKTAQANLIQAEKMASLGQLTAGIAHEIKNPLNFVNNFAALSVDLLSELKETAAPGFAALTDKQRAEVEEVSVMLTSNLEKITEHGKRADGIVKAMLEHSRGSSGERRMVDLNALIDEALNLAYHGARAQDQSFNVTLDRDFGEGIAPIEVNPQDITRVFLNLFANGFYAVGRRARDGGDARFLPTLKVITIDAGEAVEIRVRDNGTGIPTDIRDKLFQPFFTTKPTGEGTGLGLSITYDIVMQQHGGNITVDSRVGEYSEFTIRLPRNP